MLKKTKQNKHRQDSHSFLSERTMSLREEVLLGLTWLVSEEGGSRQGKHKRRDRKPWSTRACNLMELITLSTWRNARLFELCERLTPINWQESWQNPLKYCKVISLQLIKINGKKIYRSQSVYFSLAWWPIYHRRWIGQVGKDGDTMEELRWWIPIHLWSISRNPIKFGFWLIDFFIQECRILIGYCHSLSQKGQEPWKEASQS